MRTFFTTEVPQEIRDAVASRDELTKEQIVALAGIERQSLRDLLKRHGLRDDS